MYITKDSGKSEIERIEKFYYGNRINFFHKPRIKVVMVKVFNLARLSCEEEETDDDVEVKVKTKMKMNTNKQ